MKIYTSYFGNWRALKKENILMIGVSRVPPTHFKGVSIFDLAPTSNMLSMPLEKYDIEFQKILAKRNPEEIVKQIEKIAECNKAEAVALCCFEKEQTECHRYDVGIWLNKAGFKVFEFKPEKKITAVKPTQFGLF